MMFGSIRDSPEGKIGSETEIGTFLGKNGLWMVMLWPRMWLPLLQILPTQGLGKWKDSGATVD